MRPALPQMEAYYLDCVRTYEQRMGKPPTIAELAAWVGKSNTAVYSALRSLMYKGYLAQDENDHYTAEGVDP